MKANPNLCLRFAFNKLKYASTGIDLVLALRQDLQFPLRVSKYPINRIIDAPSVPESFKAIKPRRELESLPLNPNLNRFVGVPVVVVCF